MEVTYTDGTRQLYEDVVFARGGQGDLYMSKDGHYILKLFNNLQASRIAARLKQVDKIIGDYNVGTGPYWGELFSWPDKRVVSPQPGIRMPRVMDLTRMDHYFYRAASLKLTSAQHGWWLGRVACGIKLARAIHRLASRGLCHSDLSDRNIMVDPFSGQLTVLDCDSLVVPGELPADVVGTMGYIAPEIMLGLIGNKTVDPTTQSDLHALAVILYRWLLYRHPLQGPKVHSNDPGVDEILALSERALYIEHPTDRSNRPDKLQFTADDILTPRMAALFRQAFVDGLHAPHRRPVPSAWERALLEMLDHLIPCAEPRCELKFFVVRDGMPLQCPLCHTYSDFPDKVPLLNLQEPRDDHGTITYYNEGNFPHYFAGWPDRPLYAWNADVTIKPVPGQSGAGPDVSPHAVIRYDAAGQHWYLENVKLSHLQAGTGNGSHTQWESVPPGRWVELRQGQELLLGEPMRGRKASVQLRRVH